MIEHGGDIYRFSRETGLGEKKIIDFSASINPLGVSDAVKLMIQKCAGHLCNYPDPDTTELRRHLSLHHGIDPESILCGNGSTELIYLITRSLKPKDVLIPAPTFSEYERACRAASDKLQITYYKLQKKNNFVINPDKFISFMRGKINSRFKIQNSRPNSSPPFDMVFLCNPNNPTGRGLKKTDVLKIADAAREMRCHLIVDEAFIDFCPDDTVIKEVQNNPYLIVLRSMTKFYGLAGLRIGYGIFPVHIINILKRFKEPWTVNTLAQRAAIAAIQDTEYADKTIRLIKREKGFLENGFRETGIKFYPSDANFYLLETKDNGMTYLGLREKGILVRDCSNFRGLDDSYIRIAVKSRQENKILIKALKSISEDKVRYLCSENKLWKAVFDSTDRYRRGIP